MTAVLGAIKGVWRGVILLVLVALLPSLAWLIASYMDGAFGMGFATIFLVVLGLEAFLGIAALFGIAEEVQKRYSEETAREQAPH